MKLKKGLSLVLSLILAAQLCLPVGATAADANATDLGAGETVCTHHTVHTPECGYTTEGAVCAFDPATCTECNPAPAEPVAPVEPTVPTEPVVPVEPTVPAEPVAPVEPTVPTEPTVPEAPVEPTVPEVPAEPAVPDLDASAEVAMQNGASARGGWLDIGGPDNYLVITDTGYTIGAAKKETAYTGAYVLTSSINSTTTTNAPSKNHILVQSSKPINITIDSISVRPDTLGLCAFAIKSGAVNLTLVGKNDLKSGSYRPALLVDTGASLTITAESTGTLNAKAGGYVSAIGGIGGSYGIGGNITILGGTVNAQGTGSTQDVDPGAAISGTTITISGGVVSARAGYAFGYGLGIGINGSFSTGTNGKAAIATNFIKDKSQQSNWKGLICNGDTGTIYGGSSFILPGDFTIPSQATLTLYDGMTLTIPDKTTLQNDGKIILSKDGKIVGKVTGNQPSSRLEIDISGADRYIVIADTGYKIGAAAKETPWTGPYFLTGTTTSTDAPSGNHISVKTSGAPIDITLNNVNIQFSDKDKCAFSIDDGRYDVNLTLVGDSVLKGGGQTPGLRVGRNKYLVITAESTGSLTALGGTATAGIGDYTDCGDVTIKGGVVTAKGGNEDGAGIGCGRGGTGGSVTISGGTVTAIGATHLAAGIGSGYGGSAGTFYATGNAAIITSSIGDQREKSRWKGLICEGSAGAIYGDTSFTLPSSITIPSGTKLMMDLGQTLTVPEGKTLTVDGNIYKSGGKVDAKGNIVHPENIWIAPPTDISQGDVNIGFSGSSPDCSVSCRGHVITGTTTSHKVVVGGGKHDIILRDAVIDNTNNSSCAFALLNGAEVNLTIFGNNTLRSDSNYAGLAVRSGTTLTITKEVYGQLSAFGGDYGAGIGSDYAYSKINQPGTINIKGGIVDAFGGADAAGIGGGWRSAGGTISISGGLVCAKGGNRSAGIGGGFGDNDGAEGDDKITITGGMVEATGGKNGAGIGCGYRGSFNVTISGGKVTATGGEYGAGIGGGDCSHTSNAIALWTKGGTIAITGGDVTATGGDRSAGIGGGEEVLASAITITIDGGIVNAAGGLDAAGIGGGYAILEDGGRGKAGPNITISGGTVNATGWREGAGIGGGHINSGGNISINGGTVNATGGKWGAGIGGGSGTGWGQQSILAGTISIKGGTITANGGEYGAGIGGAYKNDGGSVTIDGDAVVFAKGGVYAPTHIGNGAEARGLDVSVNRARGIVFDGDSGIFYGSGVELKENATLPLGKNLTIPEGKTLIVPGSKTLTNNATLLLDGGALEGSALEGSGTLAGNGIFKTSIVSEDIRAIPKYVYTGKAIEPPVTVRPTRYILRTYFTVVTDGFTFGYRDNTNAGTAKVVYANGSRTVEKSFVIAKAGTTFESLTTYNGATEATAFTYGDTITVKAKRILTGVEANRLALMAMPAANQMALYLGAVQVSDPAGPDANGVYTLTCKAGGNGFAIGDNALTAKYVGTANIADYAENVTITLSPKALTAAPSTAGITYNGNTAFSGVPLTLTGVESGDEVTATADGTIASADVGTYAFINPIPTLSGTDSGKYTLVTAGVSGNVTIAPATPSVSLKAEKNGSGLLLTATTKGVNGEAPNGTVVFTYGSDGKTVIATVSAVDGVANYQWSNPPAGDVTVTASFGASNGNYKSDVVNATATVTVAMQDQAALVLTPVTGKTYGDGSFTLSTTGGSGNGTVSYTVLENNGVLTISGNGATIVGAGTVTVTAIKAGDATFNEKSVAGNITIGKLGITVSLKAQDKIYNGDNIATASYHISGMVKGDDLTASGTATFANQAVGTNKEVTATGITLGGADVDKYTVRNPSATATASITPKPLSWWTSGTVASKIYNGSADATVDIPPTLTGMVGNETVVANPGTVTFASANVGTHAVTATGFGITGAGSANYSAPADQPTFANGIITAKEIIPTVAVSGAYAFTGSQITPTFTVKDGEAVIPATNYTVSYGENVNVKTGGSVTVKLKGNYSGSKMQAFPIGKATSTSVVAPEPILMTVDTVKAYSLPLPAGAGNAGTLTYRVDAPSGTKGIFSKVPAISTDNKNLEFTSAAGTAKDQTAAVDITIVSDNYKDFTVTLSFGITAKRSVTLTGLTALNSTYDGTAKAGYTGTLKVEDREISADEKATLIFAYKGINGTDYTGTVAPVNAGSYKLVVSIVGTNIDYTGHHVDIPFTIKKAPVTVAAGSYTVTKAWNGTTAAGKGTPDDALSVSGILKGETVTVTAKPQDYLSSTVGDSRVIVDLALSGTGSSNYVLKNSTVEVPATITSGAASVADAPKAATAGATSITLKPVTVDGETVEYAKGDNSTTPGTWQDSTTFSTLTPNTTYYFFARVKGNTNHPAGASSSGTLITTAKKAFEEKVFTVGDGTVTGEALLLLSRSFLMTNGTAQDASYAPADAFGAFLPDGAAFTKVAGPDTPIVMASVTIVSGNLVFTSKKNDEGFVATDVYTITMSSTEFQDVEFTMGFSSCEKGNAAITATMGNTVYDGAPVELPTPSAVGDGVEVTLTYTYQWKKGSTDLGTVAPTDVGDYTLIIHGSNNSYVGIREIPFTITPAPVTVTPGTYTVKKPWNGNTEVGKINGALEITGILGKDAVSVTATPFAYSGTDAGQYNILVALELDRNIKGNYTLKSNSVTVPGTIGKLHQSPLTAHAVGDKVYGGSMTLSAIGGSGSGALTYKASRDGVLAISGSTASIVGIGTVTVTATKAGDKNHEQTTAQITLSITPKPVTVNITAADKVYDGTTTTAVTYTVNGNQAGDAVTASGTAAFADKNVGIGKTVSASGITLSGAKKGNYILTDATASATASITPKTLTWGASGTVASKVYDTTNSATIVTYPKLTGVFSSDTVSVTKGTVTFANANVGTHAMTATDFGIEGISAGNYTAPTAQPVFANGTINAKNVENPIVAISGAYAFIGSQITPTFAVKDGETVIPATDYTVSYGENINVKTGGSVTIKLKGNYSGSKTQAFSIGKATSTSVVAPEPILMTADTVKAYSIPLPAGAGNAGTLTYRVDAPSGTKGIFSKVPAISTDNKNLEFTSAAGTAKDQTAAVVITIVSDNYKDFTVTLSFEITKKKSVTLTGLSALNSTYDGTRQAGYQGTLLVNGNSITEEQRKTLNFAYKGINGIDYTDTVAPVNAGSYNLVVSVVGTNIDYTGHHVDIPFTIKKAPVTVAAGSYTVSKPWNGATNPGSVSGSLRVTGGVNGETVTVIATPHDYASSDVGNSYTVIVDLALSGTGSGNYVLKNSTITVTGAITSGAAPVANAPSATPISKSDTSITLKPVTVDGETVEYAKGDNSTTPGAWQDSTTFGTLTPNTKYYFFARVKGNGNHSAGVASSGTAISTVKGVHPHVVVRDIPILNGTASNGTITLTDIFGVGNVPQGAAFQSLTGMDIATRMQSFAKADDTTLSYVSLPNPAGTADTDTFTITVTSTQYKDITFTIRFITTDKVAAEITANMSGKVYDGTPITKYPTPTAKAGDEAIMLDYTFRWTQGGAALVGQPKNAGSYQLEVEGISNTHLGGATITVTIEKAPLTITAEAVPIFAGAEAAFTHTVYGLAHNETLDSVRYDCGYAKENGIAGQYPVTPIDAQISGGNGNYAITYVPCTLTVILDTTALDNAIAAAKAAKNGVSTSDKDPSQVSSGTRFVTAAAMDAFNSALVGAEASKTEATTNGQITAAADALTNATEAFVAAIQTGSCSYDSVDWSNYPKPKKPSVDRFIDMKGHLAEESIRFVVEESLFNGISHTLFAPDMNMTRGMLVTVLYRQAGSPMVEADKNTWYSSARAWAMQTGISDGTSMDDAITRQELVTMLHRYAKHSGIDVSIGEDTNILSFSDAFDLPLWSIPAFQWFCGANIVEGTNENLLPTDTVTRAQMATILQRFVALKTK